MIWIKILAATCSPGDFRPVLNLGASLWVSKANFIFLMARLILERIWSHDLSSSSCLPSPFSLGPVSKVDVDSEAGVESITADALGGRLVSGVRLLSGS